MLTFRLDMPTKLSSGFNLPGVDCTFLKRKLTHVLDFAVSLHVAKAHAKDSKQLISTPAVPHHQVTEAGQHALIE
jgi:hypothetical protein